MVTHDQRSDREEQRGGQQNPRAECFSVCSAVRDLGQNKQDHTEGAEQ
jgi:hypothetical protein